jgi:hypothetical protein
LTFSIKQIDVSTANMRTRRSKYIDTQTRPVEPPRSTSVFEKKEFAAMKMDVQRRVNSTMIRTLILKDNGIPMIQAKEPLAPLRRPQHTPQLGIEALRG